jgi:hypothetical protein
MNIFWIQMIDWIMDVFDRLLVVEAVARGSSFVTADENVLSNVKHAIR